MHDFNTQAILLRKYKVSEADLSLVVLTEKFGKINLWMKGVRKSSQKYGSFVDFFSVMEIGIYKLKTKEKNILKNIKIIEHNYSIRQDFEKFNVASFMLNVVNKMTETETGSEVFELLKNTLNLLENVGENLCDFNVVKYWFIIRLLNVLGYKFELDECVGCGLNLDKDIKRVLFSIGSGGIVCNICKQEDLYYKSFADTIVLDYELFSVIKKLSLSSNFCNLSLNDEVRNKLNFFMNKVINYYSLDK